MKTRAEVANLKASRYYNKNLEGIEDEPGFEEYRDELKHFREIGTSGFSIDFHGYAAEIGLLDNLKLALKIQELEDRLDRINYPESFD